MKNNLNQMQQQNQGYGQGIGGFITSPQFANGLLGAGRAIMQDRTYGGNPAAGFIGFGEGLQAERQRQIENTFRQQQLNNVLRGGATGGLVDRMRADPGFARSFYNMRGASRDLAMGQDGNVQPIAGAPQARKNLNYADTAGKKEAALAYDPFIAENVSRSKEEGKNLAEKNNSLASQEAKLPMLLDNVEELKKLGQKATFSYSGRLGNAVKRELGADVGEGAIARAKYIAMVDNQILPLLRDTFGAQFTEREGKTLRDTLGNPNLAPAEKDAALDAFINQKIQNANALSAEINSLSGMNSSSQQRPKRKYNPQTGKVE